MSGGIFAMTVKHAQLMPLMQPLDSKIAPQRSLPRGSGGNRSHSSHNSHSINRKRLHNQRGDNLSRNNSNSGVNSHSNNHSFPNSRHRSQDGDSRNNRSGGNRSH